MLKKKTKRSCTRHPDAVAVSYCVECKMFMCAEHCQGIHTDFFGSMHKVVAADSLSDFALSGGKCTGHPSYALDSLCTDCNGKATTNNQQTKHLLFVLTRHSLWSLKQTKRCAASNASGKGRTRSTVW